MQNELLIEKINGLPPEKVAEVEAFVDFLQQKDKQDAAHRLADEIAAYAAAHAGTDADLDAELEGASIEFLNSEQ